MNNKEKYLGRLETLDTREKTILKGVDKKESSNKVRKIYDSFQKEASNEGYLKILVDARAIFLGMHGRLGAADAIDDYHIGAMARTLIKEGAKAGDVEAALYGGYLYEKLGKGQRAIPDILKSCERDQEGEGKDYRHYRADVEKFIKNNARGGSESGLGGQVSGIISIIGLGAAAIFLSPSITGNAIGNINSGSSNIVGIIGFLVGLLSAVFYFKGK